MIDVNLINAKEKLVEAIRLAVERTTDFYAYQESAWEDVRVCFSDLIEGLLKAVEDESFRRQNDDLR